MWTTEKCSKFKKRKKERKLKKDKERKKRKEKRANKKIRWESAFVWGQITDCRQRKLDLKECYSYIRAICLRYLLLLVLLLVSQILSRPLVYFSVCTKWDHQLPLRRKWWLSLMPRVSWKFVVRIKESPIPEPWTKTTYIYGKRQTCTTWPI